jgi:hypothetical protein
MVTSYLIDRKIFIECSRLVQQAHSHSVVLPRAAFQGKCEHMPNILYFSKERITVTE